MMTQTEQRAEVETRHEDSVSQELSECIACKEAYEKLFLQAFGQYITLARDTDKYAMLNISHDALLGAKFLHGVTH